MMTPEQIRYHRFIVEAAVATADCYRYAADVCESAGRIEQAARIREWLTEMDQRAYISRRVLADHFDRQ